MITSKLSGHRLALWPVSVVLMLILVGTVFFVHSVGLFGARVFSLAWVLTFASIIGVGAGFYNVPLYALIQHRAPEAERSAVIAGNNILNAIFMVLAAVLALVLGPRGFSQAAIILVGGALIAIALPFSVWLLRLEIGPLVAKFVVRFGLSFAYSSDWRDSR